MDGDFVEEAYNPSNSFRYSSASASIVLRSGRLLGCIYIWPISIFIAIVISATPKIPQK